MSESAERKEKFTPGPWSCTNVYHEQGIPSGHVFSNECIVAIAGDYGNNELLKYNKDRWDADKNLIAAAPDMYAALKDVAAYISEEGESAGISPLLQTVLSALAKARGES